MARPSGAGVRFLVRREGGAWTYHRLLRDDFARHVVGQIALPWRGRVVDLTGRKVIKISLGTTDQVEATRRRDIIHVKIERMVERARSLAITHSARAEPRLVATLTDEQVRIMGEQTYHEMLASDDEWMLNPTNSQEAYLSLRTVMAEFMRYGSISDMLESPYADDPDPAHSIVDTHLAKNGLRLLDQSPDRNRLALAILRAMQRAYIDILARHQEGKGIETPPEPPLLRERKAGGRGAGKTLADAYEGYCAEKRPKARTAADYKLYCDRFTDLFGEVPLTEISTEMMLDFKDALLHVPVDIPHALRGSPFGEVVAWGREHPKIPKLSPSTINDRGLGGVSAVLGWAVDQRWIERNPRSGVKVATPSTAPKKRVPYDVEDLHKIFAMPVFSSGERPRAGAGEAAYWLPFIALWSGMRLQEIGQLRVSDVIERVGVWYFQVQMDATAGAETSVKTSESARRVPLHHELIRLGFLDYVAQQRSAGHVRLFHKLHSTRETITAGWSKWWGRYVREVIPDSRKVFHSFRHAAKDAWRDTDADENVVRAIMGHKGTGVAEGYGAGYTLRRLNDTMQMLAYPGLKL